MGASAGLRRAVVRLLPLLVYGDARLAAALAGHVAGHVRWPELEVPAPCHPSTSARAGRGVRAPHAAALHHFSTGKESK